MKKKILGWIADAIVIVGLLCFVYGIWLAWKPLGYMVSGVLLAAAAFFIHYGAIRKTERS